MSTFTLPSPWKDVNVKLPDNLTADQLLAFRPFRQWLDTMRQSFDLQRDDRKHIFHENSDRFSLRSIVVQSVDWWGKRIGFITMKTEVRNEKNEDLAGTIFLRGGSVAVLMIIRPEGNEDERLVIMTKQPRIPAGSLSFYEIPAGMIDDSGTFVSAAAKEIREETGLRVVEDDLIDMTEKALSGAKTAEGHLPKAMYPSPGGCDEFISLFLWERVMSRMQINEVNNKLRGVDKEKIKVKLVKYEELWREGARDAKTLAAWALYEGLSRENKLYPTSE